MQTRSMAIFMTLMFGWCGGHQFYLERKGLGLLSLLVFWTGIPALVALCELFYFVFLCDDKQFDKEFMHPNFYEIKYT